MKKIVLSSLVAIAATAFIGCETASNTNTNVRVNGNTVANNTAVVVNSSNSNLTTANTNSNRAMTREEFDKDRARYESEAKEAKSTIGTGANDLWIWTKTRASLTTVDELRDSTINVDVNNAVVTLRGTVGTAAQKTAAETAAKAIEGVTSVKNDLKVDAKDSMTNQATSTVSDGDAKTNTNTNRK